MVVGVSGQRVSECRGHRRVASLGQRASATDASTRRQIPTAHAALPQRVSSRLSSFSSQPTYACLLLRIAACSVDFEMTIDQLALLQSPVQPAFKQALAELKIDVLRIFDDAQPLTAT